MQRDVAEVLGAQPCQVQNSAWAQLPSLHVACPATAKRDGVRADKCACGYLVALFQLCGIHAPRCKPCMPHNDRMVPPPICPTLAAASSARDKVLVAEGSVASVQMHVTAPPLHFLAHHSSLADGSRALVGQSTGPHSPSNSLRVQPCLF
jgi:hypothetical protein